MVALACVLSLIILAYTGYRLKKFFESFKDSIGLTLVSSEKTKGRGFVSETDSSSQVIYLDEVRQQKKKDLENKTRKEFPPNQ